MVDFKSIKKAITEIGLYGLSDSLSLKIPKELTELFENGNRLQKSTFSPNGAAFLVGGMNEDKPVVRVGYIINNHHIEVADLDGNILDFYNFEHFYEPSYTYEKMYNKYTPIVDMDGLNKYLSKPSVPTNKTLNSLGIILPKKFNTYKYDQENIQVDTNLEKLFKNGERFTADNHVDPYRMFLAIYKQTNSLRIGFIKDNYRRVLFNLDGQIVYSYDHEPFEDTDEGIAQSFKDNFYIAYDVITDMTVLETAVSNSNPLSIMDTLSIAVKDDAHKRMNTVNVDVNVNEMLEEGHLVNVTNTISSFTPILINFRKDLRVNQWYVSSNQTYIMVYHDQENSKTIDFFDLNGALIHRMENNRVLESDKLIKDKDFIKEVKLDGDIVVDINDIKGIPANNYVKDTTVENIATPKELKPFDLIDNLELSINSPVLSDEREMHITLAIELEELIHNGYVISKTGDVSPYVYFLATPTVDFAKYKNSINVVKNETYIVVHRIYGQRNILQFFNFAGNLCGIVSQVGQIPDYRKNDDELRRKFFKKEAKNFNIVTKVEDIKGYDITDILN